MSKKVAISAPQIAFTHYNAEKASAAPQITLLRDNTEMLALYRIDQVLKIIPVSRSHWWSGISQGIYPRGIKLSARVTVWKSSDIQALISSLK